MSSDTKDRVLLFLGAILVFILLAPYLGIHPFGRPTLQQEEYEAPFRTTESRTTDVVRPPPRFEGGDGGLDDVERLLNR